MDEPALPHFRCVLLGEQSLMIECGERLLAAGHTITAVVTDAPRLRDWALERQLLVESSAEALLARAPESVDWVFSITWLKRLPSAVLALGRRGALNFHDGPLPRYAGLNTPAWALLAGETRYGIRWHGMTEAIDAGEIWAERDFAIDPDETAFSLNAKCFEAGLAGFETLLEGLMAGQTSGRPQPPGERRVHLGAARPLEVALLDPRRPATALAAIVRALDYGPYANPMLLPRLRLDDRDLLVRAADAVDASGTEIAAMPGTVLGIDQDGLRVRCAEGVLRLRDLATLDGERLAASDVLAFAGGAGHPLPLPTVPADSEAKALRRAAAFETRALTALLRATPALPAAALNARSKTPADALPASHSLGALDARELALLIAEVAPGADGRHVALGLVLPSNEASTRWVYTTLPIVLEADPTVSIDAWSSRFTDALDAARHAGGWPSDLPAREPRLAGVEAPSDWPVQLHTDVVAGSLPALGAAALAILRSSNGEVTLVGAPGRIDAAGLARLAEAFEARRARAQTDAALGDMGTPAPIAPPRRTLDFGLFYWNVAEEEDLGCSDKYRLLLESARFADTHDFIAVWTPERHFQAFGGLFPNPAVTSAALATMTSKVALRAGSCVVPLHHPIRIAEEWAVVDNLSNGRVGISIAAGWATPDFALRPENHAEAKRVMFEATEQVRRLWRGETLEFPGPQGSVKVRTLPRPLQAELPVWVTTAGNPETFAEAGRMGAHLLTHLLGQSVDELAAKIVIYRTAWREAGHAGQGIVSLMLHTLVGESREAVEAAVRDPMKAYLKSAMALVKTAAWQFPTFKRMSAEQGQSLDAFFQSASETDMDELLEFAFQRYFSESGLFGSEAEAIAMAQRVSAIDVDEIACLIDFGLDTDIVLAHLPALDRVRAAFEGSTHGAIITAPKGRRLPPTRHSAPPVPTPPDQKKATAPSTMPTMTGTALFDAATIEAQLRAHWIGLLGFDDFGRDDNFFDLGGHSLLVVQLLRLLREAFGEGVRVTDLFRHTTVAAQARFLRELSGAGVSTDAAAPQEANSAADRGRARAEARRALAARRAE